MRAAQVKLSKYGPATGKREVEQLQKSLRMKRTTRGFNEFGYGLFENAGRYGPVDWGLLDARMLGGRASGVLRPGERGGVCASVMCFDRARGRVRTWGSVPFNDDQLYGRWYELQSGGQGRRPPSCPWRRTGCGLTGAFAAAGCLGVVSVVATIRIQGRAAKKHTMPSTVVDSNERAVVVQGVGISNWTKLWQRLPLGVFVLTARFRVEWRPVL